MFKNDFLLPTESPVRGIGRNLYILGTAEDGPLLTPTRVFSPEDARRIFGEDIHGTLVRAYNQAYETDPDLEIYLMRITGRPAIYDIVNPLVDEEDESSTYFLRLKSIYAGEKYNELQCIQEKRESTGEELLIIQVDTQTSVVYNLADFSTLKELVFAINRDCQTRLHPVIASTDYPDLSPIDVLVGDSMPSLEELLEMGVEIESIEEPTPSEENGDDFFTGSLYNFYDGDNGTDVSRDELYLACEKAYELLLGRAIDILIPAGLYVDDVHPVALFGEAVYGSAYYASNRDYLQLIDTQNNNRVVSYHEQLIDFCRQQMRLGYMTHGVMGLRPLDEISETIESDNSYIIRLVNMTAFRDRYGFQVFVDGQWRDKGFFLSVVASELIFHEGTENEYYDNGAVVYAAMLAGHYDTTTNMPLPTTMKLRYELHPQVLADLSKLGIVTFYNSIRNGLAVSNGVTTCHYMKEMHSIANVRMVQLTLAYVNDAKDRVYEEDYDSAIRAKLLNDLVLERLEDLQERGVITWFSHSINIDATNPFGDLGAIDIEIRTKYTVEAIATSANITYLG
jgi:hypothetical protein